MRKVTSHIREEELLRIADFIEQLLSHRTKGDQASRARGLGGDELPVREALQDGEPYTVPRGKQGTPGLRIAGKNTSGKDITLHQTILLTNNNNPKLWILHMILPFKVIW